MSCHFHLMRRRKAVEAAHKAAEAAQTGAAKEEKGNIPVKGAATLKAAKGRRKGEG